MNAENKQTNKILKNVTGENLFQSWTSWFSYLLAGLIMLSVCNANCCLGNSKLLYKHW